MSTCDLCQSEFSCGRLATALKVAAATIAQKNDPKLRRAYDRIRLHLDGLGWAYPDSKVPCPFADKNSKIQALTDELIAALRHHPRAHKLPPETLISEEYSRE